MAGPRPKSESSHASTQTCVRISRARQPKAAGRAHHDQHTTTNMPAAGTVAPSWDWPPAAHRYHLLGVFSESTLSLLTVPCTFREQGDSSSYNAVLGSCKQEPQLWCFGGWHKHYLFISSLQKQLVEEEASQHYTCMLSCCSCFEEIHYNLHLIYLTYANRNYSKSSLAHYQRMKIMKDRNAHLEIEQTFI